MAIQCCMMSQRRTDFITKHLETLSGRCWRQRWSIYSFSVLCSGPHDKLWHLCFRLSGDALCSSCHWCLLYQTSEGLYLEPKRTSCFLMEEYYPLLSFSEVGNRTRSSCIVLFCCTHRNNCSFNSTAILLVCSFIAFFSILMCCLHLNLYWNCIVLPWHVIWGRTDVLMWVFHLVVDCWFR